MGSIVKLKRSATCDAWAHHLGEYLDSPYAVLVVDVDDFDHWPNEHVRWMRDGVEQTGVIEDFDLQDDGSYHVTIERENYP